MVEFRVQRLGLQRRWVILRFIAGQKPAEVGTPYDDPVLAMQDAKQLNMLAQKTNRSTGEDAKLKE